MIFGVKILRLQFWGTQSKISQIFKTVSDSRHFFLQLLFSEEKNLRGHEKRYGPLKHLPSESHNFFSFNLRHLSFGDQNVLCGMKIGPKLTEWEPKATCHIFKKFGLN